MALHHKEWIPVQLFGDFKKNVPSSSAGAIAPQMKGAYSWGNVRSIFPEFIARCLEEGITEFGKKIPGYDRDEAVSQKYMAFDNPKNV